jgi:hypothetical protein
MFHFIQHDKGDKTKRATVSHRSHILSDFPTYADFPTVYIKILTGSSSSDFNVCRNAAPVAPSTTR